MMHRVGPPPAAQPAVRARLVERQVGGFCRAASSSPAAASSRRRRPGGTARRSGSAAASGQQRARRGRGRPAACRPPASACWTSAGRTGCRGAAAGQRGGTVGRGATTDPRWRPSTKPVRTTSTTERRRPARSRPRLSAVGEQVVDVGLAVAVAAGDLGAWQASITLLHLAALLRHLLLLLPSAPRVGQLVVAVPTRRRRPRRRRPAPRPGGGARRRGDGSTAVCRPSPRAGAARRRRRGSSASCSTSGPPSPPPPAGLLGPQDVDPPLQQAAQVGEVGLLLLGLAAQRPGPRRAARPARSAR